MIETTERKPFDISLGVGQVKKQDTRIRTHAQAQAQAHAQIQAQDTLKDNMNNMCQRLNIAQAF